MLLTTADHWERIGFNTGKRRLARLVHQADPQYRRYLAESCSFPQAVATASEFAHHIDFCERFIMPAIEFSRKPSVLRADAKSFQNRQTNAERWVSRIEGTSSYDNMPT